ncbi:unnamed protein product [Dovyalis caffra]|uniref:Uncharacterized protein n=1 Tax=Dovyalis caffra TaxID=77055 RepID=A0AAV1S780_9ROSI|nr:unnamed protein product [Dovyalis caffra]
MAIGQRISCGLTMLEWVQRHFGLSSFLLLWAFSPDWHMALTGWGSVAVCGAPVCGLATESQKPLNFCPQIKVKKSDQFGIGFEEIYFVRFFS